MVEFFQEASTWASRPKKMPVSSERKGRRPGYGVVPSRDGGMFIGTSSLQAGEEGVEITFIQAVGAVDNMEMWYGDTQRGFWL